MGTALIVDDDTDFSRMMAALVAHKGFATSTAPSLGAARRHIAKARPDLVLLDLLLPDGHGMSLLDDTDLARKSEVILMTGHASLETSIQALRHGAADYLVKPVSSLQLDSILSRVMRPDALQAEVDGLHAQLERTGRFGPLVGRSGRMELMYEQIARVARTGVNVFLNGETGSGKELVARTVHGLSRRRTGPFVSVHCGSLRGPEFECRLFGQDEPGFLELARGGTLFLNDICEMPPAVQARLMRAIATGFFTRVGSSTACEADVRVIAASGVNPAGAVAKGMLREDLYYRLNVFPIEVPALRDHMEDLPLLAAHLLHDIGRASGQVKHLAPQALQRLRQYRWPGNVRELRNALVQSCVMTPGREIRHPWLPADTAAPAPVARDSETIEVPAASTLAQAERAIILATLERHGHHKERTASALGISPKTLYNRLKQYGL
jgi:two-component system response regulator AtoC